MSKKYVPFAAGMATMLLLAGMLGAAFGAEQDNKTPQAVHVTTAAHQAEGLTGKMDDQIYSGGAGVALFGREAVAPGAVRTTDQGTQAPTVLTYVDEKGCANHYISAETLVQVLDIAYGVTWNEELQCVDFGSQVLTDGETSLRFTAEGSFDKQEITVGGTTTVSSVGKAANTTTVNGVTITSGSVSPYQPAPGEPEESKARIAKRVAERKETTTAAEYGLTRGIFTETDPNTLDQATFLGYFLSRDTFASEDGELEQTVAFCPIPGCTAAVTIENTGEQDLLVWLVRPRTVGEDESEDQSFSRVRIPAGKSLMRTFSMADAANAYLLNRLTVHAETVDGTPVSLRLSAEQYGDNVTDASGK